MERRLRCFVFIPARMRSDQPCFPVRVGVYCWLCCSCCATSHSNIPAGLCSVSTSRAAIARAGRRPATAAGSGEGLYRNQKRWRKYTKGGAAVVTLSRNDSKQSFSEMVEVYRPAAIGSWGAFFMRNFRGGLGPYLFHENGFSRPNAYLCAQITKTTTCINRRFCAWVQYEEYRMPTLLPRSAFVAPNQLRTLLKCGVVVRCWLTGTSRTAESRE